MRQPGTNIHSKRMIGGRRRACASALIGAFGVLGLLGAAPASASFQQVDIFAGTATVPQKPGEYAEEVQLGGVAGMAVNRTGAGGVPPGTLYASGQAVTEGRHFARYSPEGDFELAWSAGRRCGPKTEEPPNPKVPCKAIPDGQPIWTDVDVDQTTGNVYAFEELEGLGVVHVFSPDGAKLIAQFGSRDSNGTAATSPEKFHSAFARVGNIAVDNTGTVYVFDEDKTFYHRLMVFQPETPGDYENYEYAGEILGGLSSTTNGPSQPILDETGNLYVAGDGFIEEYDPAQPTAPICKLELKKGGLTSLTVNPVSGEPFYYSYKDEKIHQLACNSEGKFVEVGVTGGVTPHRKEISAMAFNPSRQFAPARPPGVLYAGSPSFEGGKSGESAIGYILAPPEEIPPEVNSESVTQVTTTRATLNAQINPKGSQTNYVFQYIDEAAYEANEPIDRFAGASEAPAGTAVLGSGTSTLSAAVAVTGLTPDTAYHYRVIATSHCAPGEPSKVCEDGGADQAFRTFAVEAPGLRDNRVWELISPAQKNGGEVLPADPGNSSCGDCKPGTAAHRFAIRVTSDGDGIAYQGSPFSLNEGASEFDEYVSRRTALGWQTTSLSPTLAGDAGGAGFEAFALDSGLTKGIVYAKNPALTPEVPDGYRNLFAQSASDRFSLDPLLRTEPEHRSPSGINGFQIKYAGGSADLSLVFFEANDALTEETPLAPEAVDGGVDKSNLYEWRDGQLRLVNVQPGNAETIPGATFGSGLQLKVSANPASDFSNAISEDGSRVFWSSEGGQVYVRENGETTKAIPDSGKFLSATSDGSKVLLSNGHVYNLEGEVVTDLTEGKGGFQGLAGQSEDLSSVYFVDTMVLDETPDEHGAVAEAGEPNLYSWHEGALSYVATLLASDNGAGSSGVWDASPVLRTAEASPDGRWLAFGSLAELTGVDSVGACKFDPDLEQFVGSAPCEEVFLYDSAAGKLICASCNPVGEHPHGASFLRLVGHALGSQEQPRYLTNQGRLYFDSRDSLSVHDTNGKVEDVYQYEPPGVGSCSKEAGCVSLISPGHEPVDSNFFAMDESGKNVFFTSRDQLVLKDKDDALDLYVAREGGGIPAETETGRSECQGEACQPQISAPNDPTPASSAFEGAGNVEEQKAKKKKAHKKKHKAKKHAKKQKRAAKHNRGGAK
jgi:hypothetical protein